MPLFCALPRRPAAVARRLRRRLQAGPAPTPRPGGGYAIQGQKLPGCLLTRSKVGIPAEPQKHVAETEDTMRR